MSENSPRPANEMAVSASELQRLYEARAREEDRKLLAELASRREMIELRERLANRMGRITDLYELSRFILREAQESLGFAHGILAVVGEDQFLEVAATTEPIPPNYRTELLEEAFIVGETLRVEADELGLHAPGNDDVPPGTRVVAVPVFRQDETPLGVILLEGAPRAERAAWLDDFVALATEALEDCRAYARLEALIVDAAIAIARDHDGATPGRRGHNARVEGLALQLAQALGLGETMTKRVRLVALLHGLSATQVAAGFQALRRGEQTGADWAAGLEAPFVGGIYASPLADFQAVLDELRYLHARWDGRGGEPLARGEEIPLAARIVAVAIAFAEHTEGADPSFTAAVAEVRRAEGARFDPAVIRALEAVFREVEIRGHIGPS